MLRRSNVLTRATNSMWLMLPSAGTRRHSNIAKSRPSRRRYLATREPMVRIYFVLASAIVLGSSARAIAYRWQPNYAWINRILDASWL